MTMPPSAGAASQVRVGVRIRPLTPKETSEGGKSVVDGNAFDRTVSLSKRKFTYDSVFHPGVSQCDLYSSVAPPLLDAFLGGYNATILAYGQTGSGKTYTMGSEAGVAVASAAGGGKGGRRSGGGGFGAGGDDEEEERDLTNENSYARRECAGLIPRFMSDLFDSLARRRDESERALLQSRDENDNAAGGRQGSGGGVSLVDFKVSASFLEVYGEDIYDLLDDDRDGSGGGAALRIREDSNKEVIVVGLRRRQIGNAGEAMHVLNTGTMNRTTAATLMNFTSSRSHAVFTVYLNQTTRGPDGDELQTLSRFTFVDLAGSERMKKTGAEGTRAREGIKINEGLLALGNVINALADEERLAKGERVHVPYRQSKLTRLLQDALGGNSQTLFLACVSPSDTNASETLSTLHYANRARNIRNAPTRNVDAAAEELRRLRALTNLLKCELVRQRFDGGGDDDDAVRDDGSKANDGPDGAVGENDGGATNPRGIGVVDENLLRRDDVVAYLKQIEERASQLSGSPMPNNLTAALSSQHSYASSSDRPMPQSFLGSDSPPRSQVTSRANSPIEEEEDDYESEEVDAADPDEDMHIIDELLEHQHEEQISKIDGDIAEQEERLLQLRQHMKVYSDMKEKYEALTDEVEKLEAEKQELAEKLEKAQSGTEGSNWIMTKLEQVKSALARARQDVRKQQQKCRDAELEAQRCKGLERRIEEMKCAKANLIRKQRDDAKRHQNFSKTKAREIQDALKRERSAQKRLSKLEAENQRLRANLERNKTRHEKLASKLKEAELNLRKAQSSRRGNSTPNGPSVADSADGRNFAPPSPKIDSIKYVLDKTVSDRVALAQARKVYKSKVELRKRLKSEMTEEIKLLNQLKRECGSDEETLAEVKDREDNVQDLLIQVEVVENHMEELQAKFPSLGKDEDVDGPRGDAFDEHEPALKMMSKLNGPVLRRLLLELLGSCFISELARQGTKDELGRKVVAISTLEEDVATLEGKVNILTTSLEKHQRNGEKFEAMEAELQATKDQLERAKNDFSVLEEDSKKEREKWQRAVATLSYDNKLLNELKQSHAVEVERITEELKESHRAEVEKLKSQLSVLEQATASHNNEISKMQSMIETSSSQLLSLRGELGETREAVSSSRQAAEEAKRCQSLAEEETQRITHELNELKQSSAADLERMADAHAAEVEKLRSALADEKSREMEQTLASHVEEMTTLTTEFSASREALQRELDETRKALVIQHRRAEEEISQLRSEQRQIESIEEQINSSVSNKTTLLQELEKTALIKELDKTKEALSSSDERYKRSKRQLAAFQSELEQTKEELSTYLGKRTGKVVVENAHGSSMEGVEIVEMKFDKVLAEITPQAPSDEEVDCTEPRHPRPSLAVDTSTDISQSSSVRSPSYRSPTRRTPTSTRSSSSAVLPTYSKLKQVKDSLKQRKSPHDPSA